MTLYQNLIGGNWMGSDGIANINPSDLSDVIGEYSYASPSETLTAIDCADQAFAAWSRTSPQFRCDILERAGLEIIARQQELGTLLAREEGKTLPEAIGETVRAGQIFKFFAQEALRIDGDAVASTRPGVEATVTREALGVIGIITPWNFPIAIPAWKIAPALAYGNTVVFKPAELTPGCAWALADILKRAGVPDGVFNLVMGTGASVGQSMLEDRRVTAISFTGSVATGQKVASACVGRGARFQLEMGGKNPLVILDDANLDVAVDCALNGAFFSTGQRCTASSRLIVEAGIHDRFVEALTAKTKALKVGPALDPSTQIGPVVDARQLTQNEKYIALGKDQGAELVCGGNRVTCQSEGYFLQPALFINTDNQMRINREEIFGPVASVIKVSDYDQALAVANDTEFGLSAGICTTSLKTAHHFKRNVESGMVMVNLPTAGVDYHVPFGGRKGSSYGPREQGRYARDFYTIVKTAYIAP